MTSEQSLFECSSRWKSQETTRAGRVGEQSAEIAFWPKPKELSTSDQPFSDGLG
jgi:hypothetical protein